VSELSGEAVPERATTPSKGRLEGIYTTLRDGICLDYPPGTRLREEELAAEFQVSRTPIGRVLARLESEGLLVSRHGVGTIVTDVDIIELTHVYRLRLELADIVGRLSPLRRSPENLARMRVLLARADALVKAPEPRVFACLNMDFREELAALTGNPALREINDRLYFQTTLLWFKAAPRLDLSFEAAVFRREIIAIPAAAEVGDLDRIGHIRRAHISMSFRRMLEHAQDGTVPAAREPSE
jgi:DNA-binding GntR family transcriptional regulator